VESFLASWEAGAQCRRLSWLLRASIVETKGARLARILKANFNPNRPRVPAGNSDGGQWTSTGGGGGRTSSTREGAEGPSVQLAGGFTEDQMGLTVQGFVSGYCLGSIQPHTTESIS
jgi:hypothetical protein